MSELQVLPENDVMSFRAADVSFAPHSPQSIPDSSPVAPPSREASPGLHSSNAELDSMWDHDFAGSNSYAAAHALATARSAVTDFPEDGSHAAVSASPLSSGSMAGDRTALPARPPASVSPQPSLPPPQRHALPAMHASAQPWTAEPDWSVQLQGVAASQNGLPLHRVSRADYSGQMPRPPDVGGHADAFAGLDSRGAGTSPGPDMHPRAIQDEVDRLRMEREHVSAIRANLHQAQQALDQERLAFEAHKVLAASLPAAQITGKA